jgi:hypothetical protein
MSFVTVSIDDSGRLKFPIGLYAYLITPEAQPVIHRIPDNGVLKNHTG